MLKLLLAGLLSLGLVGCHPDTCKPEYGCQLNIDDDPDRYLASHLVSEFTVDPSLRAEEVEALLAAADSWNLATDGKVRIRFAMMGEGDVMPERMVVRRAVEGELEPKMLASYFAEAVRIRQDVDARWLKPVLVHELGHFLGLGHEGDPDSIMYPNVHHGMPEEPTADAVDDLAYLYSW